MIDLEKLFGLQKKLDERIVKEKGLEGQDLLDKKILTEINYNNRSATSIVDFIESVG